MDVQLKQRLVGLTVIFSLAVIFLPMLLDGSGIARDQASNLPFPAEPEVEAGVDVEELVLELDKHSDQLVALEPVIVDEISDPPSEQQQPDALEEPAGKTDAGPASSAQTPAVNDEQAPRAAVEAKPVSTPDTSPESVNPATAQGKADSAAKESAPPAADGTPAQEVEPEAREQPEIPDPRPGGQLWVVQTGSFQEKEKAYAQRDAIRKSRIAAVFIEKYRHQGQLRYRVRLGPFLTREEANVVRNKLRAKNNLRSILMKYEK